MNPFAEVDHMLALDFMRNAAAAGTAIALAGGLVGYFVVLRNQVFTSDALGHAAFTAGLGALLAGVNLLAGVFAGSVAVALGMAGLGGRGRGRDVAIGTVFAWVLGLGVLFLSLYTTNRSGQANGTAGVSILFGSIFGLQHTQTVVAVVAGLATALILLVLARPLLFLSVDPDVAVSRGVPSTPLGLLFLGLVGVTVAESVQAVGALLIFALMVTPAATAQRLTSRPYLGLALSALLAIASVWLGLVLAYHFPYPPSFFITALAFGTYLAVEVVARR